MSSHFDEPKTSSTPPQPDPFPELNQPLNPPASEATPLKPQSIPALSALLLNALAQSSRAARGSFFGVLLLLAVHAIFVVPALELSQRQQLLAGEKQRLSDLKPRLTAMLEPLGTLRQLVDDGLQEDLQEFLIGVEDDLQRLDLAVDEIRAAAAIGEEELLESLAQDAHSDGAIEAWEIADTELRFDLAQAENAEEVRTFLAPLVDNEILRPRLGRLNNAWKTKVLPHLEARIDGLASDVPRLRGSLPEADEDWARFANSLSEVRRQAREFEIEPPSGIEVWSQANGEDLILRPSDATRQELLNPLPLDELRMVIDRLVERHDAVAGKLESSLAALPGTGQDLAHGLQGVTPGWPSVAALFPALLGLFLAGFSLWRSRALSALSRALTLEPDAKTLLWLRADLASGRPGRSRGLTWAYLRTLALALAAALWIGLAAWHQDRSGVFSDKELFAMLAFGGGCVFLATVYRLFSLQALWSVTPAAATANVETREDEQDLPSDREDGPTDFLDQHTIQH